MAGSVVNSGVSSLTVMSSEDSSSYPDDSELELGLGLSLGGSARAEPPSAAATASASVPGCWDQYARILTAKDFSSASSSSSSSPALVEKNGTCGTKRAAPSSPPAPSALRSQVAGWPPVPNYRMNTVAANHAKLPGPGKVDLNGDKCKITDAVLDQTSCSHNRNDNGVNERGLVKKSLFVKVNVDGIVIGRKVDLNAHSCYETLAHALDQMFELSAAAGGRRLNIEEQLKMAGTRKPALLLDGSSDFVLTYEDKDGDWMLVGDVPWDMFLSSVRRLRIRRTSEVNGPGANTLQD